MNRLSPSPLRQLQRYANLPDVEIEERFEQDHLVARLHDGLKSGEERLARTHGNRDLRCCP